MSGTTFLVSGTTCFYLPTFVIFKIGLKLIALIVVLLGYKQSTVLLLFFRSVLSNLFESWSYIFCMEICIGSCISIQKFYKHFLISFWIQIPMNVYGDKKRQSYLRTEVDTFM